MPHIFEAQPIEVERFYTGVISQRNPLAIPIRIMGRRIIELYDAILSGGNAEITVRSTLQRRAGYIPYNTNPVPGIPQTYYAFNQASTGTIFPIIDTSTDVLSMPPGSTPPLSLISKVQGKQSNFFAVGNYLYIGNPEFSKKWDTGTPQGLTNWGIAIGSINNANGPNGCGVGTDVPQTSGTAWSNPSNITADDGNVSSVTLVPGGVPNSQGPLNCGTGAAIGVPDSNHVSWASPGNITSSGLSSTTAIPIASFGGHTLPLRATNFGFNIPSTAVINGISAVIRRSAGTANTLNDNGVFLVRSGSAVGTDHSVAGIWSTAIVAASYGGSSDLWGFSWTPGLINDSSFGIQIAATNNGIVQGNATVYAFVTITVSYTTPAGGTAVSDLLQATSFAFAIPGTNTVSGILVEIKGNQPSGNPLTSFLTVSLMKGGSLAGTVKTNLQMPLVSSFTSLGSSSDLWGTTWTPNDVDNLNFGVSIQGTDTGSLTSTWNIDFVRVTIFGTGGPAISVNPAGGSFSATQGYQYVQVFGNSNDNNISNPSPPSFSTGVFTNKLEVDITLTASTDPQVNQIRVFRTVDTGTGGVFFELPTSPYPNVSATVPDSAGDTSLIVSSSVQLSSLAFSPPPAGLALMAWYAGRMWGAVKNLLYFSAGPDNFPMGNGNSDWPPANVFELPGQIVKLVPLSGGNGMLVWTFDKIHVVQGITNPGFTVNVWMSDIGARQQNAIDSDGSTIYVFTSDRQELQISASGINELTQYVSDTTDNFDPTVVRVTQHRSGSQDSRVFLSDGSSQMYPYNLMANCWEPIQTPVDGGGAGAIGSIEITPGNYKFLKGATSANQLVLQRDINTFTDNGVPYSWGSIFGNIPLTDPTQMANVDSLVLRMTNAGNLPQVSVLPNDISGSFIPLTTSPIFEPPEGSAGPTGHRANRYYFSTGANLWQQMMHCQIQFAFGPSAAQEEILTWGLFPNPSADQGVGKIPDVQGR